MTRGITANADDEQAQQQAAQRAERQRLREVADLRTVLATVEGRRLLWRIITAECGVYRQTYASERPSDTAFGEGQRSIGLMLLAAVADAEPEAIIAMQVAAQKALEIQEDALSAESAQTDLLYDHG